MKTMRSKMIALLGLMVIGATAAYGSQIGQPKMNGKLKVGVLSPEKTFYTGKPYSKALGAYVFNYRNYDPQIARWTTPDPSGFPDGANNLNYAPQPTSEVDALGLVKVSVSGTPTGNTSSTPLGITMTSGSKQVGNDIQAKMGIAWHFTGNVFSNGWIVQHVQITNNVFNAYNTPYKDAAIHSLWEAWQVTGGTVQRNSDTFQTEKFGATTHGSYTIAGNASYYTTFPSDSPDTWPTNVGQTGGLHATLTKPSWWADGAVTHSLTMTWE